MEVSVCTNAVVVTVQDVVDIVVGLVCAVVVVGVDVTTVREVDVALVVTVAKDVVVVVDQAFSQYNPTNALRRELMIQAPVSCRYT
ncbi:MAG: hypothetical protein ACQEWV_26585 [Bacillota bacterium]